MITIIAGSRSIDNPHRLQALIDEAPIDIEEVVSGGADGVDSLGERFARANGIPLTIMPALWDAHGKAAGMKRNARMALYADALLALWDGQSPGTKDMLRKAYDEDLAIFAAISGEKERFRHNL